MCFTTFQDRTMVYRAKKKIKPGVRAKFDLTKSRYRLLTDPNKIVKQNLDIKFVMLTLIIDSKLSGLVSLSTTNSFLAWMNCRTF